MTEPVPDLHALLADPPPEVEVLTLPNQVVLRFGHPGWAPIAVRTPLVAGLSTVGMIAGYLAWFAVWVAGIAVAATLLSDALVITVMLMLLIFFPLVLAFWFPGRRTVEIELLPGEVRIERWRRPLRELGRVRHTYVGIPSRIAGTSVTRQHRVELDVGDQRWKLNPTAGDEVSRWLALVLEAARARALEDTAEPPAALLDLRENPGRDG